MITIEQAIRTVENWRGLLRFLPSEEAERAHIAVEIVKFVSTPEQLYWLERAMIETVGEWPGSRELRALFCTRFKPQDGIEIEQCDLIGHRPNDIERENTVPTPSDYPRIQQAVKLGQHPQLASMRKLIDG